MSSRATLVDRIQSCIRHRSGAPRAGWQRFIHLGELFRSDPAARAAAPRPRFRTGLFFEHRLRQKQSELKGIPNEQSSTIFAIEVGRKVEEIRETATGHRDNFTRTFRIGRVIRTLVGPGVLRADQSCCFRRGFELLVAASGFTRKKQSCERRLCYRRRRRSFDQCVE